MFPQSLISTVPFFRRRTKNTISHNTAVNPGTSGKQTKLPIPRWTQEITSYYAYYQRKFYSWRCVIQLSKCTWSLFRNKLRNLMYLSPTHQNELGSRNKLSSAGTIAYTLVAICNNSIVAGCSNTNPSQNLNLILPNWTSPVFARFLWFRNILYERLPKKQELFPKSYLISIFLQNNPISFKILCITTNTFSRRCVQSSKHFL